MVALTLATSCTDVKQESNAPIIGRQEITVKDGRMTPEALWAMGRIGSLSVSPDGKKIAYTVAYYSVEQDKSHRVIYVMDADGSNNTLLTTTAFNEGDPQWIKGGTKIAFLSNEKSIISSDEFSMIDWCAAESDGKIAAFFSPDLHSCDYADNQLRLTIVHPTLYADHAPFVQKFDDGWMDFGVNHRVLWIAEYDQVPLSSLPKRSQARLNNGEVREITAHPSGDPMEKYEFFRMELPDDQVIIQELRRNEKGETELTLQNTGNAVGVELPGFGKADLPAYSLRTFRWK